jgi:hypothetical protein
LIYTPADCDAELELLFTGPNCELEKVALWLRANKMAVNIGKKTTLYLTTKEKIQTINSKEIVYDDKEPHPNDPLLIVQYLLYHNNHDKPECRAYTNY